MPAVSDLPLAASFVVIGAALFFGGGPADGSLVWLGGLTLVALVTLTATVGLPGGWVALAPLAVLAAWLGASIGWSSLPDRSWNYADRALVYVLVAALGLWVAGRTRQLALGLAALFGAVLTWTLLGKVLPPLYDYGAPGVTRLRGPVGLWNQLALVAVFALPLALWLKRVRGALLAYAALVALVLTYSRGGAATAIAVACAWFVLDRERIESGATLVAAAIPAGIVVGIAFVLPGITSDGQPTSTRWRDGLLFGALLLGGAAGTAALTRAPRPPNTPRLRRALLALGVVAVVVVAVGGVLAVRSATGTSVGNNAARFGSPSSNFRTVWWRQALDGWRGHELAGTGAGSFHLTNLRFRDSYLDVTTEPHDLPLQFLSEAGVVGLALLVLACGLLLRGSLRRRGHELALALILPAYLLHSLVDVDWDFVAVSVPAFLVAGALVGRPALRRVPAPALVAACGLVVLAFGVLLLPWLGSRWANEAIGAPPSRAVTLADRAESVDRLLVEPLWAKADAAIARGEPRRAFGYFVAAVDRQPQNPQTWLYAGQYALSSRCWRLAYTYLERYTELDPKARPESGANDKDRALRLVNAGRNACGS
jgi:hypothetical protein